MLRMQIFCSVIFFVFFNTRASFVKLRSVMLTLEGPYNRVDHYFKNQRKKEDPGLNLKNMK